MAKNMSIQNKFIVINKKHLAQLGEHSPDVVERLVSAITEFQIEMVRKCATDVSTHKYFVCNQDEPYANQIITTILTGEANKE